MPFLVKQILEGKDNWWDIQWVHSSIKWSRENKARACKCAKTDNIENDSWQGIKTSDKW